MASEAIPSEAQARFLATRWGKMEEICIGGFENSTVKAMLNKGWIGDTGRTGSFPNGAPCKAYRVNKSGMAALSRYLAKASTATIGQEVP